MNAGTDNKDIDSMERHAAFRASRRKHVLMITNHGIHQWRIVPGLPDTGGQNVFVNHFSAALAGLGFRVTIANRGGYAHPVTGRQQKGLRYKDEHQRILYLQDSRPEFVRKEDMGAQVFELVEHLRRRFLGGDSQMDAIISHYWDAARIGVLFNRSLPEPVPHVWVPHSVGTLKKRNMEPARWEDLRVDERIETEQRLIGALDGVASTSAAISEALAADYDWSDPLFLPPCVDPERYQPREVADDDPVWAALCEGSGASLEQIRGRKIVTEISRTDRTKRKDVLLRAFARVREQAPDSFLVVTIDDDQQPALATELRGLARDLGLQGHVAVLGSVWDLLPSIYAVTDVYCTPSVMEGFGMSIQEAAATGVPAVSSDLVPFAVEYLRGADHEIFDVAGGTQIQQGRWAMVVPADDVAGFAAALLRLLGDDELKAMMGAAALEITVPYFTWESRTRDFLQRAGI